MFTIDLLKGRGIPIKSRPANIVIAMITFAVPTIVIAVMLGVYLRTRVIISIQNQGIVSYEKKIQALGGVRELQELFEKEKNIINNCLSEVSSSIGRHIQWSPILVTMIENMPDSVVLTGLEVKQRSVKRKVPKEDDPSKTIDISVPVSTLHMAISGRPRYNSDKQVKDFRERLRSSELLKLKLEDITVSQEFGKLGEQGVVSYKIDCVFKPQL